MRLSDYHVGVVLECYRRGLPLGPDLEQAIGEAPVSPVVRALVEAALDRHEPVPAQLVEAVQKTKLGAPPSRTRRW